MADTLLIVAGDCGFGFDKPAYFNEERIGYKRWRTVQDYSVISACNHNILCIGGAISIDWERRMKQQVVPRELDVIHRWHPFQDAGHYGILRNLYSEMDALLMEVV